MIPVNNLKEGAKGSWMFEYTDRDGWSIYRIWDRDNKCLTVMRSRQGADLATGHRHLSYEIWASKAGYPDMDEAARNLIYRSGGIYGNEFINILKHAIEPLSRLDGPTENYPEMDFSVEKGHHHPHLRES